MKKALQAEVIKRMNWIGMKWVGGLEASLAGFGLVVLVIERIDQY